MDRETARVEALNALADPAFGLGALVAYELRALRTALAASERSSDALARTLSLALQYPFLRPVDLSSFSVPSEAAR